MDLDAPTAMLGGLSPAAFMKRHWQKQPLLVRQAFPGIVPPLARPALFALAGSDDVESRLVAQDGQRWRVRHGPLGGARCRRCRGQAGRCWCRAWTCTCRRRTISCSASASCLTRGSTT